MTNKERDFFQNQIYTYRAFLYESEMDNQDFYEQAILAGMLIYNDSRPIGYLKNSNFSRTTHHVSNAELFDFFSKNHDFISRITEIRRLGDSVEIFIILSSIKGAMTDYLGINTPRYCLLLLEIELKKAVLSTLVTLIPDSDSDIYKEATKEVYCQINLGEGCFLTDAENIISYFRHIGFDRGVFAFEELYLQFEARIKQINQNYELQMCINRLRRYCDNTEKEHLIPNLELIETELTL